MQKINFITHFFLKVLLVILGNMSMSSHPYKMIVSIWKNLWCLSKGKKSVLSLRYCKDITNLLFWLLWEAGYAQPKWYYKSVENFFFLFIGKNQLHPPLFWSYCEDMKTSCFGYFGHTWLRTPKMTVSTCWILQCLCACQK